MISYRDKEHLYRWIGPGMLNFVVAGFIFGIRYDVCVILYIYIYIIISKRYPG